MGWEDSFKKGEELVLATVTADNKPHANIVISLGFVDGKLLVADCQMSTTRKNLEANSRACVIGGHSLTGSLKAGTEADIAIFDPDKEWTVNPREFASLGRNTPLAGRQLKGRVMATVCRGELVYGDGALRKENL